MIASLFWVAAGCGDEPSCDLGDISRDLGGVGLTDCGIASADDTDAVDRCAVTANNGGSTFRAVYERENGDLEAIVRAAGGAYLTLRQESGSSRIERADCESARVVAEGGRTYVECVDSSEFELVCDQ